MKKYNSWEELRENFLTEYEFECEGERFQLDDEIHGKVRRSFATLDRVRICNTHRGVEIEVFWNGHFDCYFYHTI